jgi:hypothetical protein
MCVGYCVVCCLSTGIVGFMCFHPLSCFNNWLYFFVVHFVFVVLFVRFDFYLCGLCFFCVLLSIALPYV